MPNRAQKPALLATVFTPELNPQEHLSGMSRRSISTTASSIVWGP